MYLHMYARIFPKKYNSGMRPTLIVMITTIKKLLSRETSIKEKKLI